MRRSVGRVRDLPSAVIAIAQRHAKVTVAVWLLLAAVLGLTAPSLTQVGVQDETSLLARGTSSQQAQALLEQAFPTDPSLRSAVVVFSRSPRLTPADGAYLRGLTNKLVALSRQQRHGIEFIQSAAITPGAAGALRSTDGQAELVLVGFATTPFEPATRDSIDWLREEIDATAPAGLTHHVTGSTAIGVDQEQAVRESFERTGLVTVVLLLAILLLVYRSIIAAFIPLLTIGVSFLVGQSIVAMIADAGLEVATLSALFMVVIVFGAGTDYCLFLISRYRKEATSGEALPVSLRRATTLMAGVITAAGATVALGFVSQLSADFGFYRTSGPAVAIAVLVTVLATLTFTPALLRLLGDRAFWPRPVAEPVADGVGERTPWTRLGVVLARRPREVAIAAIIPLIVLANGAALLHTSADLLGQLPASSDSKQGAQVIEEHYAAGLVAPVSVLLRTDRPLVGSGRLTAVDRLTDRLRALDGVAEVRSATQPAGAPLTTRTFANGPIRFDTIGLDPNRVDVTPLYTALASRTGLRFTDDVLTRYPALRRPLDPFLGRDGHSTRLIVALDSNPYSKDSQVTLARIREVSAQTLAASSWAGSPILLGGPGPTFADVERASNHDFVRIGIVLLLAIFAVLLWLLRSLLLPLLIVATSLLSYAAAIGFAAAASRVLFDQPSVTFYLPVFLLVILVALAADYSMLIASRIREEYRAGHSITAASVTGLTATGPVIANAGFILAGTFAALMLAPTPSLRAMGLAVAFGVLLDTLVVRPILLPALVILLGEKVFWPGLRPVTSAAPSARARGVARSSAILGTASALLAAGIVVALLALPSAVGDVPQVPAAAAKAVPNAASSGIGASARPRPLATPTSRPQGGTTRTALPPNTAAVPTTAATTAGRPTAARPTPTASSSRITVPAAGTWTYDVRGTRKIGAAGSTQPYSERTAVRVDRLGGTSTAPVMRLRSESNAGTEEYHRRYVADRVQLLHSEQSSLGLAFTGSYEPPLTLIYWPASIGRTWVTTWTASGVRGRVTTTITGTRSVAISGRSYSCYVVDSRTRLSGDAEGEQRETSCWVPDLGMSAQDHRVFHGTYNGVPVDTDTTATLLATP